MTFTQHLDDFDKLLSEAPTLASDISSIQGEKPSSLSLKRVNELRAQYEDWYSRAREAAGELLAPRLEQFYVDRAEIERIRSFWSGPARLIKWSATQALDSASWKYPFEATFKDPFNQQLRILQIARLRTTLSTSSHPLPKQSNLTTAVRRILSDGCVNLTVREIDEMFVLCGAEEEWWIESLQRAQGVRRTNALGWLDGIFLYSPQDELKIASNVAQMLISDNLIPEKVRPILSSALNQHTNSHTGSAFTSEAREGKNTNSTSPKVFIVHGHDERAKWDLKNYLQNTLGLPEPIVLHEKPNHGRTVIEKFEHYAKEADFAAVLLTPDDTYLEAGSDEKLWRARQNVILELGYFLGRLGRDSGKVIVFYKGRLDIPSDIAGLIYIDISHGVISAGEMIRRELGIR